MTKKLRSYWIIIIIIIMPSKAGRQEEFSDGEKTKSTLVIVTRNVAHIP